MAGRAGDGARSAAGTGGGSRGVGVREQPGVPAAATPARVLARQQLLLVLDNCEHVIGAAAELCAQLLAVCDDLRILATSREALRVVGEARYRLGPLAVPDADDPADGHQRFVGQMYGFFVMLDLLPGWARPWTLSRRQSTSTWRAKPERWTRGRAPLRRRRSG